ncbi:MAG: hypothetical protein ABIZ81_11075 [Opitutaceae bacterium]
MTLGRISALPLICYAVLVGFASYAASRVGHWPHYSAPDPTELAVHPLTFFVTLTTLLGLFSVVALPIAYGAYRGIAAWKNWPAARVTAALWLFLLGATVWILDVAAEHTQLPWSSLTGWIFD